MTEPLGAAAVHAPLSTALVVGYLTTFPLPDASLFTEKLGHLEADEQTFGISWTVARNLAEPPPASCDQTFMWTTPSTS